MLLLGFVQITACGCAERFCGKLKDLHNFNGKL